MSEHDFNQSWLFIATIAGDPNTAIVDFRAIHDTNKAIPAIPFRGTLSECWSSIVHYNGQGYGIFAAISAMDGAGLHLNNVAHARAHFVDLDNSSASQNYTAATKWELAPALAVQTSLAKFHVYWPVQPYTGNDRFQVVQRKLRQIFDGDKTTIDASRVMRLPGTFHLKNPAQPQLVTCWQLAGADQRYPVEWLEYALQAVNIIDGGVGVRLELGDPSLAAPSLEWVRRSLTLVDPNDLDRGEWIAITSAIKQAGWSLASPEALFDIWAEWCAQYVANDHGENRKQWDSIRNTELGWPSLLRRVPTLQAVYTFGGIDRSVMVPVAPDDAPVAAVAGDAGVVVSPMPTNEPPPLDCSGEYLTHIEQAEWFKGCTFVVNRGEILMPDGRFLGSGKFNGARGGKKFIVDSVGKMTNEAWAAATRSTLWTVPKVDHTRFLPAKDHHTVVTDELGRKGINTYRRIDPLRISGDPSPFINHIKAMLPSKSDQQILFDFIAHNIRFPGHKIPWAPVIQSGEGTGKGLLKRLMIHAIARPYIYFPNAKELTNSGSQFNAWMRSKLFILADEIKVDDRLDLIEVLKPMISEHVIEIQSKGVDQELEDNFSNWMFFTNWKNAIPINKNGRRFALMFSVFQTAEDLIKAGFDDRYFNWLYRWMDGDGAAIVTDYFLNYPIERGAIPMRAPITSSTDEAVILSRSPIERVIIEAIEDQLPGFRGGWVSTVAAINRVKITGAVARSPSPQVIGTVLEALGYVASGRALRPYFQEDKDSRSYLYHYGAVGDVAAYGRWQGWE